MLIRCKLFRPGGTRVVLGKGKTARHYHFLPADIAGLRGPELEAALNDPTRDHVCDMTEKEDISTLLAIPEGYEIHDSVIGTSAGKAAAQRASAKANVKAEPKDAAANYASMKKPDLIALIAKRTGKAPHGTTPARNLIEQLEELDAAA